jgi:hypothetical protein
VTLPVPTAIIAAKYRQGCAVDVVESASSAIRQIFEWIICTGLVRIFRIRREPETWNVGPYFILLNKVGLERAKGIEPSYAAWEAVCGQAISST